MMTTPHDEEPFAPVLGTPGRSVDYCTGGFDDVEDVARLAQDVYGGNVGEWRDSLSRSLSRRNSLLVVARCHAVVIGYGKASICEPINAEDQAPAGYYLTGLIVDSAWRRRGIGAELTRWRLSWIWSHGQPAWFFANARNKASIDLHVGLGFIEVSRAASYLGEPFDGGSGVLMRADLPETTTDRK